MFWRVVRWPLPPGEFVGDAPHLAHLIGSQQPARDLGPDHVDVRLALAVDAAAQALRTQFVVRHLARGSQSGLGTEELDVLANDSIVLLFHELLFGQYVGDRHRPPSL